MSILDELTGKSSRNRAFSALSLPESILTEHGEFIMRNFLNEVKYEHS